LVCRTVLQNIAASKAGVVVFRSTSRCGSHHD